LISYWTANASVVSPKFQPARNAVTFASRIAGALANRRSRKEIVESVGRPYIQDSIPSANMFFARPASLRDSPNSRTASTVMSVSSKACTSYGASESFSSGFSA
jgi:hypothetical protein